MKSREIKITDHLCDRFLRIGYCGKDLDVAQNIKVHRGLRTLNLNYPQTVDRKPTVARADDWGRLRLSAILFVCLFVSPNLKDCHSHHHFQHVCVVKWSKWYKHCQQQLVSEYGRFILAREFSEEFRGKTRPDFVCYKSFGSFDYVLSSIQLATILFFCSTRLIEHSLLWRLRNMAKTNF